MARTYHQWQPEETNLLTELYTTQPQPVIKIAQRLRLHPEQITRKIRHMKLQRPDGYKEYRHTKYKTWEPWEEEKLREMYEIDGTSIEEIAAHFKLRRGQIQGKIANMGYHRNYEYMRTLNTTKNTTRWQDNLPRGYIKENGNPNARPIREGRVVRFNLEDFLCLGTRHFMRKYDLRVAEYNALINRVMAGEWRPL